MRNRGIAFFSPRRYGSVMGQKRSSHPTSLPNVLTASRIAAAPLLAVAVLTGQEPWIAAAIVLFAALTDLFDGIVARAQGQLSELGAVLDPIADKIFVISALFLLVADGLLRGATVDTVSGSVARSSPTPMRSRTHAKYLKVTSMFAAMYARDNSRQYIGSSPTQPKASRLQLRQAFPSFALEHAQHTAKEATRIAPRF